MYLSIIIDYIHYITSSGREIITVLRVIMAAAAHMMIHTILRVYIYIYIYISPRRHITDDDDDEVYQHHDRPPSSPAAAAAALIFMLVLVRVLTRAVRYFAFIFKKD